MRLSILGTRLIYLGNVQEYQSLNDSHITSHANRDSSFASHLVFKQITKQNFQDCKGTDFWKILFSPGKQT